MNKRVLFFVIQPLHSRPPCVAEICYLRDMGIEVVVLTTECNEPTRKLMESRGVEIQLFERKKYPVLFLQHGVNYVNYHRVFRRFFKQFWTDNTVLWVGTELGAIVMWPFIKTRHPMIVNCQEFYEKEWYQDGMRTVAPGADILTACEPRRAEYMVSWWKLEKQPYILRNKPYGEIPPKGDGSTPELADGIRRIKGKKTVLYQGLISADRDLSLLARALKAGDSDFWLVLTGPDRDGGVEKLKEIYDKVLYLGNYPAPTHLELTPHATVGVAFYKDNCINNRHCAPNKIYEYAGCGTPMLCNPIPGLMDTVGEAGAAECVDFNDPAAVNEALNRITANYEQYHQAALDFYNGTDNSETMSEIIKDAFLRTKVGQV